MRVIEIVHATGVLARWYSNDVPFVGHTISFDGKRHDCRTVVRVDWGAYVTDSSDVVSQVETVRVFVE